MRWIAEGIWVASSALHCGEPGANDLAARDMPITRDHDGHLYIPAGSLTGAARNYAGRRLMDAAVYEKSDENDREVYDEPAEMRYLFGSRMEYASALVVDDGKLDGVGRVFYRDGVRIDSETGLAWDDGRGGAKFDLEIVPAGTRFRLRFEFRPDSAYDAATRAQMLGVFGLMLEGFSSGEIRLGARTSRGYGAGRVDRWTVRRVETVSDFVAWLKREPTAGTEVSLESLQAPAEDKRQQLDIELWLKLETSLLVRSGGSGHGDPDAQHLQEGQRYVLPGTGMAGALRHRCERIANTFLAEDQPDCFVERMFGPLKKKESKSLRASRVRVDEAAVEDAEALVHTRVAIDRFTQAALETKLFEEAPLFPSASKEGHIRGLRIRLMAPRHDEDDARFEAEAGLLLLAVKDLWLGDLAVGGGEGVGRGVFRGLKATFRSFALPEAVTMTAKGKHSADVELSGSDDSWDRLDSWCQKWRER